MLIQTNKLQFTDRPDKQRNLLLILRTKWQHHKTGVVVTTLVHRHHHDHNQLIEHDVLQRHPTYNLRRHIVGNFRQVTADTLTWQSTELRRQHVETMNVDDSLTTVVNKLDLDTWHGTQVDTLAARYKWSQ